MCCLHVSTRFLSMFGYLLVLYLKIDDLFCSAMLRRRVTDSTKQERKEKADSSEAEPGNTDNEKNSAAAVFSFKGILINF